MRFSKLPAEGLAIAVSAVLVVSAATAAVAHASVVSDTQSPTTIQATSTEEIRVANLKAAKSEVKISRAELKAALAAERSPLSPRELKELLRLVGFEGKALKTAWAIVMKESGGRPMAHNGNASTGDNSYGLFQINMIGSLGADRREKFELKQNEELFNPVRNAEIAFFMSDGGADFGAWGLGPNAYNGGKVGSFYEWLAKYPEE